MNILGLEKIEDQKEAKKIKKCLEGIDDSQLYQTDEFAVVPNPSGIYPPFDVYPLAPKLTKPLSKITALLTDMDGTTTTTETLCLYSLEFMVRAITKKNYKETVSSLDHTKDYPHIIGNSTTKHVEYLIKTYGHLINKASLVEAYLLGASWTLCLGKDAGRINEVRDTLRILNIEKELLKSVSKVVNQPQLNILKTVAKNSSIMLGKKLPPLTFPLLVRMSIDVYYQRYHEILSQIDQGKGQSLAKTLTGGKKLIEPMPGVAEFLALSKGLLGEEAGLISQNGTKKTKIDLAKLGKFFEKNPAKIGLVTSSIFYEANIVLTEVFRILAEQVAALPISPKRKKLLQEKFSHYQNIYDAVVTATDSNEIRLKPHRDLYSIALYKMGIAPHEFCNCLGFEDSESGLIALRAAGIGRTIGVPFDATRGHNLKAASIVLKKGLPELIYDRSFFLSSFAGKR